MSASSLQRLVDGQLRPLIDAREPWAAQAEADIAASADKPIWCELAVHTFAAGRSKPGQRWLREAGALIGRIGPDDFAASLRRWLTLLLEPPADPKLSIKLFEGDNGTLLRGLVWAASRCEVAPVTAIGAAASACLVKLGGFGARSMKVASGCIWTLAALASDEAIGELTRIAWTTEYAMPSDLISRLLDEIASARGVARSRLEWLRTSEPLGTPADVETSLDRAARALEAGQRDVALDALLAAWRLTKAPSLAGVITRLGAIIDRDLDPLPDDSEDMTSAAFARVAANRRAVDVDRLLAKYPAPASRRTGERARALSELGDDPRVARALARHVTTATDGIPGSLWNSLVRIADPEVLETLESATFSGSGVAALHRATRDNAVAAIRARESDRVRCNVGEERVAALGSLLDATAAHQSGGHGTRQDLLARIHADPTSDELRLIYADLLSEAGDPRGEFIMLQLAERLDREQQERMKQLEREHRGAWLGPLAKSVRKTGLRYRRGFPATGSLPRDPRRASNLIGRPEWSTFEELDLRQSNFYGTALHPEFLLQPCLRSLRVVRGLFVEQLLVLLEHPAALGLERLDFIMQTASHEQGSLDHVCRAMDRCVSLPGLRSIRVRGVSSATEMRATRLGAAIEIEVAP